MNLEEKLQTMSMNAALLIGIGLMGFYYLVVYEDGSTQETRIKAQQSSLITLDSELNKAKRNLRLLKEFQAKKEALGEKFDKLIRYIPEKFSGFEQVKILTTQAKAAGAKITSIKEGGKGEVHNFYEEVLVDVELEGTYSQIILFLSYLTKIEKVIVLNKMKMEKQISKEARSDFDIEEVPSIKFKGTFAGFKLVEEKGKK